MNEDTVISGFRMSFIIGPENILLYYGGVYE